MVERILYQGQIISIIIRSSFSKDGIEFFSPKDHSQQLGYMNRPKGYIIKPHIHNEVPREVVNTKETLFIKNGKIRVDFYSDNKVYLESRVLYSGDVVLLAFGGHGFTMLEPSEIIEVKQGPYVGSEDKIHFEPVEKNKITIKD